MKKDNLLLCEDEELKLAPGDCVERKTPFIKCEYANICSKALRQKYECMHSFYISKSFSEKERYLSEKDTRHWGYSVFGVEYFMQLLYGIGHVIDQRAGESQLNKDIDWSIIRKASDGSYYNLDYLRIPIIKPENINIRPSEFSAYGTNKKPCLLSGILSKIDKEHPLLKGKITENDSAVIGTAMHRLFNQQPEEGDFIHNHTLKLIGAKVRRRESGCEQKAIGNYSGIRFGGSIDSLFTSGPHMAIGDAKRLRHGTMDKLGIGLQLTAYAEAVKQMLKREFEKTILITTKRNSNPSPHNYRYPRTNMTLCNSYFIDLFHQLLEEKFDFQQKASANEDMIFNTKVRMQGKNKCSSCFDKKTGLCEVVTDTVMKGHSIHELLLPEYSLT